MHIILLALEILAPAQSRGFKWIEHIHSIFLLRTLRIEGSFPPCTRAFWYAGIVDLYGALGTGRRADNMMTLLNTGEFPRDRNNMGQWQANMASIACSVAHMASNLRHGRTRDGVAVWQQETVSEAWKTLQSAPPEEYGQHYLQSTGIDLYGQVPFHQAPMQEGLYSCFEIHRQSPCSTP